MTEIALRHSVQADLDELVAGGGEVGLQVAVMKDASAADADIDTGVAIALMRNRFPPDFTAITRLDAIVAETYTPPQPEPRSVP